MMDSHSANCVFGGSMSFFDGDANRLGTMVSILETVAASGGEATIAYRKLGDECAVQLGLPLIEFSDLGERRKYSALLGEVADYSHDQYGFILTAIIVYSGDEMVGGGMRESLIRNYLLRKSASEDDFLVAHFKQMKAVWAYFRRR